METIDKDYGVLYENIEIEGRFAYIDKDTTFFNWLDDVMKTDKNNIQTILLAFTIMGKLEEGTKWDDIPSFINDWYAEKIQGMDRETFDEELCLNMLRYAKPLLKTLFVDIIYNGTESQRVLEEYARRKEEEKHLEINAANVVPVVRIAKKSKNKIDLTPFAEKLKARYIKKMKRYANYCTEEKRDSWNKMIDKCIKEIGKKDDIILLRDLQSREIAGKAMKLLARGKTNETVSCYVRANAAFLRSSICKLLINYLENGVAIVEGAYSYDDLSRDVKSAIRLKKEGTVKERAIKLAEEIKRTPSVYERHFYINKPTDHSEDLVLFWKEQVDRYVNRIRDNERDESALNNLQIMALAYEIMDYMDDSYAAWFNLPRKIDTWFEEKITGMSREAFDEKLCLIMMKYGKPLLGTSFVVETCGYYIDSQEVLEMWGEIKEKEKNPDLTADYMVPALRIAKNTYNLRSCYIPQRLEKAYKEKIEEYSNYCDEKSKDYWIQETRKAINVIGGSEDDDVLTFELVLFEFAGEIMKLLASGKPVKEAIDLLNYSYFSYNADEKRHVANYVIRFSPRSREFSEAWSAYRNSDDEVARFKRESEKPQKTAKPRRVIVNKAKAEQKKASRKRNKPRKKTKVKNYGLPKQYI